MGFCAFLTVSERLSIWSHCFTLDGMRLRNDGMEDFLEIGLWSPINFDVLIWVATEIHTMDGVWICVTLYRCYCGRI